MLELIKKIFSQSQTSSRNQANERLRVVLTHDRMNVSSQVLNDLKIEIIEVIARHFDIEGSPEVNLITEGRHAALDINIPIKGR
ncbi:MAG TPA: cell division topological specificity factor MinE [Syntrophomonadaceae bacterium]|nr:cell division topological specificity factor MinE [Syntrophomonadaceae bacterium]HNX28376.1 cell division topological specificity factor MinE [Syntrophomonadaceae bacterium]HPR92692.1 cell division topological specificity factor MinE [Syntrophomonadaceae bacterium]